MNARQAFGVFVESLTALPAAGDSQWLELPAEPTRLVAHGGGVLTIAATDSSPASENRGLIFETIRHERHPYLAMLAPAGEGVRVNGVAAPPAAVLRIRDQVELDGEFLLHVSQFSRPYHGPATVEHAGSECLVCLTPIEANSLVFVCPNCQTAMHAQGEETPVEQRLECYLSSSTCPFCNLPLVRDEGYAYVPEL